MIRYYVTREGGMWVVWQEHEAANATRVGQRFDTLEQALDHIAWLNPGVQVGFATGCIRSASARWTA